MTKKVSKYVKLSALSAVNLLEETYMSSWNEAYRLELVRRALRSHIKAHLTRRR